MGNASRGEITFVADGEERTLKLSFNAICALEQELKKPMVEIFAELEKAPCACTMRSLVRAGLMAGEGKPLSLGQAGEVVEAVGVLAMAGYIATAIEASFPEGDRPSGPGPAGDGGSGN